VGVFDPPTAQQDNERETGNILDAMLRFPVRYSFNVVGETGADGDSDESGVRECFVQDVMRVVLAESGDTEDSVVCRVTPRGTKFTKVTVEAQVDSAAIIMNIYRELESLERCVMQF